MIFIFKRIAMVGIMFFKKGPKFFTCKTFAGQDFNSNSIWTLIALNLPYSKGTLKMHQNHNSQPISVSMDRKKAKHHRKCKGVSKTKVGMPWCTGRVLAAFWKRLGRGMHESHQEEHSIEWGHQCKTITKLQIYG